MGLNGIWRAQTWSLQPRDKKAGAEGWDGAMGVGEQFAGECLEEPVAACLGKGKKNKRGMKQKKEKERKAAVEGAGARLCEGCLWQHLQQHGTRSLPAGQGWTRGQGLENQTKGSRGQCQEPAAGKDQCTTTAQSWGQPCSQGQRRGLRWQLVSVLGTVWCPQVWHFSAQWVPRGDGDTKLHLPASTSPSRESAKLQECPKPPTHTKPGNFGRRGDVLPKNHRVPEPL